MPLTEEQIRDAFQKLTAMQYQLNRIRLAWQRFLKRKSRRELIYQHARATIGRDASPLDIVNDDLGCAESVTNILRKVVKIPIITGTWTLNDVLKSHPNFSPGGNEPRRGTIIVSPTGTGNGRIRGHTGIFGEGSRIMSASSATGLWDENYTLENWLSKYRDFGGLQVNYYVPY